MVTDALRTRSRLATDNDEVDPDGVDGGSEMGQHELGTHPGNDVGGTGTMLHAGGWRRVLLRCRPEVLA